MVLDVSPTDAVQSFDDDALLDNDDGLEEGQEEPREEADPLDEIRAELAATKAEIEALKGWKNVDPERINRALLQVPALQRDFEEIRKQGSNPQSDPRLGEVEETVLVLADGLINSDLLDDASKASLRAARQRVDGAKTARQTEQRLRELVAQLPGAQPPQQPDIDPAILYAANAATAELKGYAKAKGVNWESIPVDVLAFTPVEQLAATRGDFSPAMTRVLGEIDRLADNSNGVDRVAQRRRAAGNGAPGRSGAALTNDEIVNRYGSGDPDVSAEMYDKAARALGLK